MPSQQPATDDPAEDRDRLAIPPTAAPARSPRTLSGSAQDDSAKELPKEDSRTRLRDMLVVFVTYPITPTKRTERLAVAKPWLEFISLLLKMALAAFALWKAYEG